MSESFEAIFLKSFITLTILYVEECQTTGNPGSVIVPQYGSSKITVFVWVKNIILKFLGNTK